MKRPDWQKFKITLNSKFQRHASKVPRSIAEREDPQAVTVTAAARSAASQRGLRGPVCRHRGSQHAARSADCAEELRGASAKRWRSVAECMHGAKERSQREALAECWGISAERCAHCALHSSTWCSSDLKDGCPLETCSSQDRDSLPPRVGLRSDAVMSNLLSSPQTPGGTAVSCYATSLPLPLSPSSSRPFPVRAIVTSFKKKRDEKHSTYFITLVFTTKKINPSKTSILQKRSDKIAEIPM